MSLHYPRATKIYLALALLAALPLAGCSSPEVRAQRYYDDGMKLLSRARGCKGRH